jgi:5-formyltetrahydrofolate cyclo-ligase
MPSKSELRDILRKSRQSFVNNHNISFFESFSNLPVWASLMASKSCVAGYSAIGSEADPAELLAFAAAQGKATALPYLADRTAMIEFRAWQPDDPLEPASFGFKQPISAAERVSPDLILLPLIGFDRAMNRLGQGAGHYDRALAEWPDALRIGVAWSVQEILAIPVDPWDVPMDGVFTENEWIIGPNSRIIPQ